MAEAISCGAVTRRQAITAAVVAAAIPASAIAETTDPHQAWLEEWRELRNVYNAMDDDNCDDGDRLFDQVWKLADLITDTPALTAKGIRAKLIFLKEDGPGFAHLGADDAAIVKIAADAISFLEIVA